MIYWIFANPIIFQKYSRNLAAILFEHLFAGLTPNRAPFWIKTQSFLKGQREFGATMHHPTLTKYRAILAVKKVTVGHHIHNASYNKPHMQWTFSSTYTGFFGGSKLLHNLDLWPFRSSYNVPSPCEKITYILTVSLVISGRNPTIWTS